MAVAFDQHEDSFQRMFGDGRGLDAAGQQEVTSSRLSRQERQDQSDRAAYEADIAAQLTRESARRHQVQQQVQQVKTTLFALLDEQEEWTARDLASTATARLDGTGLRAGFVHNVLLGMCGDGCELTTTERLRVRRAER